LTTPIGDLANTALENKSISEDGIADHSWSSVTYQSVLAKSNAFDGTLSFAITIIPRILIEWPYVIVFDSFPKISVSLLWSARFLFIPWRFLEVMKWIQPGVSRSVSRHLGQSRSPPPRQKGTRHRWHIDTVDTFKSISFAFRTLTKANDMSVDRLFHIFDFRNRDAIGRRCVQVYSDLDQNSQ
jgi:hypothetical protein